MACIFYFQLQILGMQKNPNKNKTNFSDQEAINKLKELIKKESICLFCTNLLKQPIETRPMSTQDVAEQGNIWFLSSIKSDKNREISENNSVQLFYSNPGSSEYLSVFGNATIINDRKKIEELWSPFANAWFEDGKNDVDVSLIRLTPQSAYYWDTRNNKMISMLKMFASMLTGNSPKDGVEGTLKVK
jgi:general stress protein 26